MLIVAAVDGEQISDNVVEVGTDLTSQYGEELVVVHVMPQDVYEGRRDGERKSTDFALPASGTGYQHDRDASGGSEQTYSIDRAQRDASGVARDVTVQTLDDVTYVGRVGDPVSEVLNVATNRDSTYLVIGGRKSTPAGKAVFGSATQSFLLNASTSVVTVMA